MPAMRMRCDFCGGEALHGGAHIVDGVIKAAIAKGQFALLFLHQLDEGGTGFAGVAFRIKGAGADGFQIESQIFDTENFRLIHGNSAHDLLQIFATANLHEQLFDFAELVLGGKFRRVGGKCLQRIHIGCKPGEAMSFVLVLVEGIWLNQGAHGQFGFFKNPLCGFYSLAQCFNHRSCLYFVQGEAISGICATQHEVPQLSRISWPKASDGFSCLLRLSN